MSVLFDSFGTPPATGPSTTWSFLNQQVVVSGVNNTHLTIYIQRNDGSVTAPTSVKYNGVACTQQFSGGVNGISGFWIYTLLNPSTGSNTIEVDWGSNAIGGIIWTSAYNVNPSSQYDVSPVSASGGPGSTTITQSITTGSNNSLVQGFAYYGGGPAAGITGSVTYNNNFTNITGAQANAFGYIVKVIAGAQAIAWSQVSSFWNDFMFALAYLTFATVTTQAASSLTSTTATGNGNITDTGGANATNRGIVYDNVSHTLPGNVAPGSSGYAHSVNESGSFGAGAYTEAITGLSANTTYYVRSYAQNSNGYSYGNEISFVYNLPTVTTQAPSTLTATSVTGNGNITSLNGGANCDVEGFVYDTSSHVLPGDVAPASSGYASVTNQSGSFGTGAYTKSITGLSAGVTYFARAYAHIGSSGGYSYGNEITFTVAAPTVTTQSPIAGTGLTSVTGNGNITATSGINCGTEGFVYDNVSHTLPGNVAPGSSGYASFVSQSGSFGTGAYTENVGPLIPNTTYFIRSFAYNGTYGYGNEISFFFGSISNDLPGTLPISGYKWLSQKLLAAQQGFAVRPYFTAQVIDDSIRPTGVSYPNINPFSYGSTAPTPDDNIVAAGFGSDNKIHFWKGRNLANGTWDKDLILDSSASVVSPFAVNQVSIAVSEYYRGTYRIDVSYFTNFDGGLSSSFGSNLGLVIWSSNDGGNTWFLQVPAGQSGFTMADLPIASYNSSSTLNLYLALMKPRLINGAMSSGFIYLCPSGDTISSGYIGYNLKYSVSPFSITAVNILAPVLWGGNVNSLDWTIHSFDTYYYNGVDYVLFSGFHNVIDIPNIPTVSQNPNYALWLTAIQRRYYTNDQSTIVDLWLPPISVMPADSATPVNQNQYIYPRVAVEDRLVQVVFKSVAVTGISITAQGTSSTLTTTQDSYMRIYSKDGKNFTYPQMFVDINGNLIVEVNTTNQLQGFIKQDNYFYLCGGYQVYQFIHNNIVADIASDVIGYTIQETAGQASAITVKVANQNNQWVGSNPTNPGAAAIVGNSKIAIWEGYYNADGIPEVVPRNIYYIDDIQQKISGTNNDLVIAGRDLYKKLLTLITRFSLQYTGPYFYTDVFDGTTIGNWNQLAGQWSESNNHLTVATGTQGDNVITLTALSQVSYGSTMVVNIGPPGAVGGSGTGGSFIYACYIDSQNWLRLHVYESLGSWGFQVESFIAGVKNTLASGVLGPNWTTGNLGFFIRQYDYYKWSFLYTDTGSGFPGNTLESWNAAVLMGDIDMTAIFATNAVWQKPWSIGVGANNNSTVFSFFRYTQFNPLTNILTVSQSLAARAGVLKTVIENQFTETLDIPMYAGQFTVLNRTLIIPPNGTAINTEVNKQIGNGELLFYAKINPVSVSPTGQFGMYCYFRVNNTGGGSTNPYNAYRLRIWQGQDGNGPCNCRFERLINGSLVSIFPNSASDDQSGTSFPSYNGSLNLDLTKYHKIQIMIVDGWMYAYIDDIMVASWNDNNDEAGVGLPYITSGFWGFGTLNNNSTITVKNISSPSFWKPIQSFSFNPGDDANNAIGTLVQTIRGWFFSDLFGRMKFKLLLQGENSKYTYDSQIWNQNVDDSNKEYVNQVIVYGTGVMATAQNLNVATGAPARDAVIVDYTITTKTDAQARADQELLNYNQYINQYEPTLIMNVGTEMFDAITVINTGNNTSGINSPTRVYGQTLNEGGGTNNTDYSMQIQTGNL